MIKSLESRGSKARISKAILKTSAKTLETQGRKTVVDVMRA